MESSWQGISESPPTQPSAHGSFRNPILMSQSTDAHGFPMAEESMQQFTQLLVSHTFKVSDVQMGNFLCQVRY